MARNEFVDSVVLDYLKRNGYEEVHRDLLQAIRPKTPKVRKRKKPDDDDDDKKVQVENVVLDYLQLRGFDEVRADLVAALEKSQGRKVPDISPDWQGGLQIIFWSFFWHFLNYCVYMWCWRVTNPRYNLFNQR